MLSTSPLSSRLPHRPRFTFRLQTWLMAVVLLGASGVMAETKSEGDRVRWSSEENPLARPWHPFDGLVSQQNPPDFSWPAASGATAYDLQVFSAKDATSPAYEMPGLAHNYHNFAETFAPGDYRWRVRFLTDGHPGEWTPLRSFTVSPDAWRFPVPTPEALMAKVPAGHPRIWTTAETLAGFRARASGERKAWFDKLLRKVRADMAKPLPVEPTFAFSAGHPRTAEWLEAQLRLRAAGWDGPNGAALRLLRTALAYLVTGEHEIGRNAVAQMLNITRWDPNGATSYETHDQVHRALVWHSAVAYDWCYGLMTPEERAQVLAMIESRTRTIVDHVVVARPVNEVPYDSHAWTVFGHVGIISIATLNDLPVAKQWFTNVWPAYINVLAPWGGEDGGWSQGPNYWQYSQASIRIVADTLLAATGFSLYDKAYYHNHAYFPLYAFPHGTPRSYFGDGNEYVPGLYNKGHYARLSQVYRDPVLKWAGDSIAGRTFVSGLDETKDGEFSAYYSGDESVPSRPPTDLPKSRWFRDIGWVAMHSDLADPGRVSLYFKSSPYGSHSHSHADQNSFVLNAYGEALAIDGGYYDAYGTPHDTGFARQTKAHNAITHDGGLGQPIFNFSAQGRITAFITHPRVDATTGDATAAYHGEIQPGKLESWVEAVKAQQSYTGSLGRALRHIIYVRPDIFVVIDDLVAGEGRESTFEWWLQALDDLRVDPDQAGAVVRKGKAALKVRFVHPSGLTARSETEFIGPPNAYPAGQPVVALRPLPQPYGGDPSQVNQVRVAFQAPRAKAVRYVAIMQPYQDAKNVSAFTTQSADDWVAINFANGDRVVVSLTPHREVSSLGLVFTGVAAAQIGGTTLLHGGTSLHTPSGVAINSSLPVTVAMGDAQVQVSAMSPGIVKLRSPGLTRLYDASQAVCTTEHGGDLLLNTPSGSHGYFWSADARPASAGHK